MNRSTTDGVQQPTVAAFDVDGTLTVRDCVVPFLRRVGGVAGIARALSRRPVESLRGGIRRDRDRIKEVVVGGVFRGRQVDQIETLGTDFADRVFRTWMRPDVVRRLRWHQGQNHRVVLVSASLGCYLRRLGELLDADGVLCTEAAATDGVYTGRLVGANCRGEEKVKRLDTWLADRSLADANLWAYGDSAGDQAMLARATVGEYVKGTTVSEVPLVGASTNGLP